jgi:hypothetical protein
MVYWLEMVKFQTTTLEKHEERSVAIHDVYTFSNPHNQNVVFNEYGGF